MSGWREGLAITINSQEFTQTNLPADLPVPIMPARSKQYYMSSGGPGLDGLRVHQELGIHVSWMDMEFTLKALTASQVNTLEALRFAGGSFVLEISYPGHSASYRVKFADDGFRASFMGQKPDPARGIYACKLKFHILKVL